MQPNLEKLEKELNGLNASLNHAVRERKISTRQFAARQTYLGGLEKEIVRLRSLFSENIETENARTPILQTKMTDEERHRSTRYLEEKFIFLHSLLRKIEKIQKWIRRSERHKFFQCLIPFQLTWLNKEIKKLDDKLIHAEDLDIELNQFIENLSNQLSPGALRNHKRDSLRKIMDLLGQQEQLQRRICKKQEILHKKQLEITELNQTISLRNEYKQTPAMPTRLPTASATQKAVMELGGTYINSLDQCKNKIEVVRDFLESMIHDEPHSFHFSSKDGT